MLGVPEFAERRSRDEYGPADFNTGEELYHNPPCFSTSFLYIPARFPRPVDDCLQFIFNPIDKKAETLYNYPRQMKYAGNG